MTRTLLCTLIALWFQPGTSHAQKGFVPLFTHGKIPLYSPDKSQRLLGLRQFDTLPDSGLIQHKAQSYFLAQGEDHFLEGVYQGKEQIDPVDSFSIYVPFAFRDQYRAAIDSLKRAEKLKGKRYEAFPNDMLKSTHGRLGTPLSSRYYDRTLHFSWLPGSEPNETYRLNIYDEGGDLVLFERLVATEYELKAKRLGWDRCFFWQIVYEKENFATDSLCVYRMNLYEGSVIGLREAAMKDSFAFDRSALQHLIAAQYFESTKIYHKALYHYQQALLLSGNALVYRKLYFHFLHRKENLEPLY